MAQVRLYLEEKNFAADEADGEFLKTPLMFAVLFRQFEVVEYLLQRSDVHVGNPTSELWTPLMMATREGDFDVVQLILEGPQGNHVTINAENHLGQTALHIAVQFCPLPTRLDVTRLLLAHGADANQRDQFGRSPIRHAAMSSQHALSSFLMTFTPVPVPARQLSSRLVEGLSGAAAVTDTYGDRLVPNKWVTSGDGMRPFRDGRGVDRRPPIATRRDYAMKYADRQTQHTSADVVLDDGARDD